MGDSTRPRHVTSQLITAVSISTCLLSGTRAFRVQLPACRSNMIDAASTVLPDSVMWGIVIMTNHSNSLVIRRTSRTALPSRRPLKSPEIKHFRRSPYFPPPPLPACWTSATGVCPWNRSGDQSETLKRAHNKKTPSRRAASRRAASRRAASRRAASRINSQTR